MELTRRNLMGGIGAALLSGTVGAAKRQPAAFPKDFIWGASSAGHQIEGNNVASDVWLLEHVEPTLFKQPSGDACNSFELWSTDLDIVQNLGLNAFRFSLEWARIEPESGQFSGSMLDHYKRIVHGCRDRGLMPIVTFNHFTTPRWFAAMGGWTRSDSADLFARFCDKAARHFAEEIGYATTLNEPNTAALIQDVLPASMLQAVRAMNAAAAEACGSPKFTNSFILDASVEPNLLAAHQLGRSAIKAIRSNLPVGISLAVVDDQAAESHSLRDAKRAAYYGAWLETLKTDDFVAVQNYGRVRWGAQGRLAAPAGAVLNDDGHEVYAPSLAGAVRYMHAATGRPIIITEHGVNTGDDSLRAVFITESLAELRKAMAEGVRVIGYCHWSLLDDFEWVFGYKPKFGLCSVDFESFKRTPKQSARLLGSIARQNAV